MRLPARCVIGNLVWSRDNRVWAVYEVKPKSYPYLSDREKLQEHNRLRVALMALPKESMILSICQELDSADIVQDMLVGVSDENDKWDEAVEETFESIDGIPLYSRRYFLTFALPSDGAKDTGLGTFTSAFDMIRGWFGIPPKPVSRSEIENKKRAASTIEARIRNSLTLRPLKGGEIRWLYARAINRGMFEPQYDRGWEPTVRKFGTGPQAMYSSPTLASYNDAIFKEGGYKEDVNRPRHRRYLRVDTEHGTAYQTFLVVSDMPHRFVFPGGGGEWFFHADAVPFPVDWCARVRTISNQEAQHKTKKQARQLVGQVSEYAGEPAGAPQSLAEAMETIDEQRAYLSANPAEPELHATIIYSVAADNLVDLEERAAQIQSLYEPNEYALPRPTGGQMQLFSAMLPGSPTPMVASDYTQYLLCRDLAAGMPFAGSEVGDPRGMLLGAMLDGGTFHPVLFDPAYGPSINRSGSLGAFGALGSGKSYFIKNVTWATLARGGQVLALDRTVTGEYVEFSKIVPGTTQAVRLATDSNICLDPLRVFDTADRVRVTIGFLTLLTGASPTDIQGAVLAEAVREVASQPNARLSDVIENLGQRADSDDEAKVLWRKLKNFATNDLGRLAFGDGDVLNLDADYIVFHAPGLSLPDKETLLNEHLAKQLLPEQVFSQALLYLVAAVARKVTFSNPDRFAAALFDEAWALTSSLQGRQLILDGIRDGRKHNAAIWLLSQHPNDLGDDELAHLLGNRFVFKQSRGASSAALNFLGMEPTKMWTEMLETGLLSGQCLFRDVRDRIGLIQVLEAPTEELRSAFETNPEALKAKRDEYKKRHEHDGKYVSDEVTEDDGDGFEGAEEIEEEADDEQVLSYWSTNDDLDDLDDDLGVQENHEAI